MRGVEKLLTKRLTQTAVYWANPVNNGFGSNTYDDPIEIKCRWEDKDQILSEDAQEKEITRAIVFVDRKVKVNELLWLGTLNDLDSEQEVDPSTITNIGIVKRCEDTPRLGSNDVFLHKAFLTPWLS